jgi:hypothetical protein
MTQTKMNNTISNQFKSIQTTDSQNQTITTPSMNQRTNHPARVSIGRQNSNFKIKSRGTMSTTGCKKVKNGRKQKRFGKRRKSNIAEKMQSTWNTHLEGEIKGKEERKGISGEEGRFGMNLQGSTEIIND